MLSAQAGLHFFVKMYVILFFSTCFALSKIISAERVIELKLREKQYVLGEPLNAMCSVKEPISYCTWTVMGTNGLISMKFKPGSLSLTSEGYEYHGKGFKNGECGITIFNVEIKHEGTLTCSLGTNKTQNTGYIILVVAKAPRAPQIHVIGTDYVNQEPDTFKEGEVIEAECTIEDGRPAANIFWFIGTERIEDGLSSLAVEDVNQEGGGWKTVRQNLSRLLKYSDNGKNLRCVADHIALRPGTLNHPIYKLDVCFSPKPQSAIKRCTFTIGQPGRVVVTFRANPLPNIAWVVDGNRIQEGNSDTTGRFHAANLTGKDLDTWEAELYIDKVRSEDAEKSYTLTASNAVGREQYKVVILTCPAPSSDVNAWWITGIASAILFVIIVIYWNETGRWCFDKKIIQTMEIHHATENEIEYEEEETTEL